MAIKPYLKRIILVETNGRISVESSVSCLFSWVEADLGDYLLFFSDDFLFFLKI